MLFVIPRRFFEVSVVMMLSMSVVHAENPFSCDRSTELGYKVSWQGAHNGSATGERGGRYWAFIGESFSFYLKTPFRKKLGELRIAHRGTHIDYSPGNEYALQLTAETQSSDHAVLQLNKPWFEGDTPEQAGEIRFTTHALGPMNQPCLQGEGEITFKNELNEVIKVNLIFAVDVSGRKFRS